MKNQIIVLLIGMVICCRNYSQTASATIIFKEKIYDFGEIQESKGKVSHTFVFLNSGKVSVTINNISSGCGCVTGKFSDEPVGPGKTGKIIVVFDPAYRPGIFSKEIIVSVNNHKEICRIWVKGTVVPFAHPVEEDYPYDFGEGLYLNLKVLAFGNMANGDTRLIKLRFTNNTNKTMILTFITQGYIKNIRFTNPGKIAAMERGQIVIYYTMANFFPGNSEVDFYPVVNGKKLKPLKVKATGIDPSVK